MSMKDTKLWTWHMASGVIILVLLGIHMLAMHMSGVMPLERLNPAGDNPLDWANVVARWRVAARFSRLSATYSWWDSGCSTASTGSGTYCSSSIPPRGSRN